MKDIKLVLKKKWFDMILSGDKTVEYRDIKPYYNSRLELLDFRYSGYGYVTFYNGYAKNRNQFTVQILGIDIGPGIEHLGAEPNKEYYRIFLGGLVSASEGCKGKMIDDCRAFLEKLGPKR